MRVNSKEFWIYIVRQIKQILMWSQFRRTSQDISEWNVLIGSNDEWIDWMIDFVANQIQLKLILQIIFRFPKRFPFSSIKTKTSFSFRKCNEILIWKQLIFIVWIHRLFVNLILYCLCLWDSNSDPLPKLNVNIKNKRLLIDN